MIDYSAPRIQQLIQSLMATTRAQADETDKEYNRRYKRVLADFASHAPRDAREEMFAAQIVGAHHTALDCLQLAAAATDLKAIDRLHGRHMALLRTARDLGRQLEIARARPDESLPPPPPADAVVPEPLRRAPVQEAVAESAPQNPIHPEKPRYPSALERAFGKQPHEMNDEELAAMLAYARMQQAEMDKLQSHLAKKDGG